MRRAVRPTGPRAGTGWGVRAAWGGALPPRTESSLTLDARSSVPRLLDIRVLDTDVQPPATRAVLPLFVTPAWQRHVLTCYHAGDRPVQSFALAIVGSGGPGEVALRDVVWQEGTAEVGWTREFEHGAVVVNPTRRPQSIALPGPFRRIEGRQDPIHNDGKPVAGSLQVDPLDACLLWRNRADRR